MSFEPDSLEGHPFLEPPRRTGGSKPPLVRNASERQERIDRGGRGNDDALYDRSGGCSSCGRDRPIYYDGMCLPCAEAAGVDGPGRDSMG